MRPGDPVYRADVIGSMLRPAVLLEARAERDAGSISEAQFKRIEDGAADEAIALQERTGVDVVTDGELRRFVFIGPLSDVVEGFSSAEGATVTWHNESGAVPTKQMAAVTAKLRLRRSLATEEYAYARARATKPVKMTLPSPLMLALRWSPEVSSAAYADPFDAFADAAEIVRNEARALIEMGCEYIQIDAPELATLVDPVQRDFYESVGVSPSRLLTDGLDLLNDMVAGLDASLGLHLCRGNSAGKWMSEGGYEQISQHLFSRASNYDVLLLEYDDHRSGSLEVLREAPDDKILVLGLVSTKRAELEPVDELLARIDEAAGHFPREQLALSTQCGFASVMFGNPVPWETQEEKLKLVAEVARRAWPT